MLLLRLTIAAIFLYHGTQKFGMWSMVAGEGMSENMLMIMRSLSVIEPLIAVLLIVGLFTQIAGGIGAVIMIGAIYMKQVVWGTSFAGTTGTGWEFDLVILGGCLATLLAGGGCVSLDALMKKK